MRIKEAPLQLLIGGILLLLMTALPIAQAEEQEDTRPSQEEAAKLTALPLEDLRTFVEVFEHIRQVYVTPITDQELLENAIRGMLYELDPHSSYLDQKDFAELREGTEGEFGGLGIEIDLDDNYIRVITPIDNTPAKKAGIEAGDLIIKIDGKPVRGMKLGESVELMRGEVGTDTTLTILRNETETLDITVTRGIIQIQSVRSELLEPGYAYIRLAQFQVHTEKDLLAAIEKLNPPQQPLKGIVLDLRNNPGGLLDAAVGVVDAFISEGMIVYTSGRVPDAKREYLATKNTPAGDIPLVILINGGSASASEIVAGSLQDHKRAVIMGTQSFGKGSVQTILPLGPEKAIKLTTALYYTPAGRSIQAEGIEPDIQVERANVKNIDKEFISYREEDLNRHLKNGKQGKKGKRQDDSAGTKNKSGTDKKPKALVERDFQLYEALNLLKGIHILSSLKKNPVISAAPPTQPLKDKEKLQ
ncbi:MAG: S41 family peptidase [Pseudomonadales bacterium]|nr:S41 family peptidase [Pseudomonadales bacterium]